ncbi:MAG: response regulator [Thermodesulfobacteriota bacterium]|nr:response regulator [Thermodesulfobacteriota bacterium]
MNEKNKAILLVSLVLLILSLAFLFQGISYSNKSLEQNIEMVEANMHSMLYSIQQLSFTPYESRINNVLHADPRIVEAFAKQDRELLHQLALPAYKALQKENEYFYIMHFHLPDGTTLLRMHNPDFYGDNLATIRPIVDAVHETKRMLTGYEIGRHGAFYRIVQPVFFHDIYIGAFELGIKAWELLPIISTRTNTITSLFFLREEWEKADNCPGEEKINHGEYTLLTNGKQILKQLPADFPLEQGGKRIVIDERIYIPHAHPILKNYQGKLIGGLVVFQDITAFVSEKKTFIVKAILFTSFLLILSICILYFTFGKMIGKLVHAEKMASNAKKEWELTFDAVPDMIYIVDVQHRIIRANKATATILDMSFGELIHSKCYESIHGSGEPFSYCPHSQVIKDRQTQTIEIFDKRLQRYLFITVAPVEDSEGDFLGAVHIVRDITAQKKAEAKRIVAEEKLQKAKRMEAIGLMAGGVAHDLNNILSGVVSYPELLLMQLSKQDKLYGPIKAIRDSGERAAAVVADLLTVARGVATVQEVSSVNVLIKDYLSSTEFRKLQSLHPQIHIDTQLADDLWNIRCSSVHIQKVLMNLITNASEAIEFEGTVRVSTFNQIIDPARVVSSSLEAGAYVIVTVQDTGSGIAEHDLAHIFEPFYTKKVMGRSGTGLGLAVVWNTMRDHGAFIRVESDDNGTTFTLYFPPCHEELIQNKDVVNVSSFKGSGSVLVVDDEEQQRDIATKMLTLLGYTVTTASSGEEAVDFCRKNSVDLVLLDMLMEPGINGLETYRKIIELYPSQKAIIASGFSENKAVFESKALGVGCYIKKPYTFEQLGQALQKVLRNVQ